MQTHQLPVTFNRQDTRGMDFICHCGSTFTFNTSLSRHYQLCKVARDTAVQALQMRTQDSIPAPSDGRAASSHSSNSSCSPAASPVSTSTAQGVDTDVGQLLEEKIIGHHQILLETFTTHTTNQLTKFVAAMTEHHLTLLQAFTTAQAQQNTNLQHTLADLHREAFEQLHSYLESQRLIHEGLMLEQRITRNAVRNLLSTQH